MFVWIVEARDEAFRIKCIIYVFVQQIREKKKKIENDVARSTQK